MAEAGKRIVIFVAGTPISELHDIIVCIVIIILGICTTIATAIMSIASNLINFVTLYHFQSIFNFYTIKKVCNFGNLLYKQSCVKRQMIIAYYVL